MECQKETAQIPVEDKGSSGYSLFQGETGPPQTIFQARLHGCEDKLKWEETPDTNIGNCSSPSETRKALGKRK